MFSFDICTQVPVYHTAALIFCVLQIPKNTLLIKVKHFTKSLDSPVCSIIENTIFISQRTCLATTKTRFNQQNNLYQNIINNSHKSVFTIHCLSCISQKGLFFTCRTLNKELAILN